MMKVRQNDLDKIEKIKALLDEADAIYKSIDDDVKEQLDNMHNETGRLSFNLRWGLQAAEEITQEIEKAPENNLPMTLLQYMEKFPDEFEYTCFDRDIDSEFYFYYPVKEEKNSISPNGDKLAKYLRENLMVTDIIDEGKVEVALYEMFEDPNILAYARKNIFPGPGREEALSERLFDKTLDSLSLGYEKFDGELLKAFEYADSLRKEALSLKVDNAEQRKTSPSGNKDKETDRELD